MLICLYAYMLICLFLLRLYFPSTGIEPVTKRFLILIHYSLSLYHLSYERFFFQKILYEIIPNNNKNYTSLFCLSCVCACRPATVYVLAVHFVCACCPLRMRICGLKMRKKRKKERKEISIINK